MKKILMTLILGMFLITLVSAVPPFQTNTNTQNGLEIFAPQFEATKHNTTFNLHLHVSNLSNGKQLNNSVVDCYIHLYSMTGGHLYQSGILEKDSNGLDHEIDLLYGNFTEAGEYNSYYIWCDYKDLGGELRGTYEITANGKPTPEGIVIVAFAIILVTILIFLMVYFIKIIGLLIEANVDLLDVAYIWGLFFGLLGVNQLAEIYLGSVALQEWFSFFVSTPFGFAMVLLPMGAFFLSLVMKGKKAKKEREKW